MIRYNADWLVSRDPRPREIRETWMRDAPAMLRTGLHFEAVRLAAGVLGIAAGSGAREAVEEAFRAAGVEDSVIADPSGRWFYALVPTGTAREWDVPGVHVLAADHYLGVPAPHRADPPGTHWFLCPPQDEGDLCDPVALRRLIAVACARAAEAEPADALRVVNHPSRPSAWRR
ncbi:hypothetical protein [Streptomyces huiliensis]|uniref:hypothetical protein n=1 Tax=Streptomyces huiliensis TaxID=2876027 RepID=UPI001CC14B1A|nr:hypothetical protein [Streptomyces huiliensis]MBZ4319900.1 hypothetical protein [Streptomyces huiliensis]